MSEGPDIVYSAAFPKSGITYLNYLLFHALFEEPRDPARIDSDYVIDIHEHLERVPPSGSHRRYVKTHFAYDRAMPLRERADRAICLVRHPIDVMMSIWDFMHLLGDAKLLDAPSEVKDQMFRNFVEQWIVSGGDAVAGTLGWVGHVSSWMDQQDLPVLFVSYEALKTDPVVQLERICRFLDETVSRERLVLAARRSTAGEMRKLEQGEIESKQAGAFYRPQLEKGYERGFRFVGRLHANSVNTVLTEVERNAAELVFGPVLARLEPLTR
jgi:hypothetical protein